ncbi:MAG TPA: hypothetical protein VGE40_10850 [Bacilli bacterium]
MGTYTSVLPLTAKLADLLTVVYQNVSFSAHSEGKRYRNMVPGTYKVEDKFDRLFFLGMTTDKPEGSEWWGQAERYHAHQNRLFIGDRLGRINIVYEDKTMSVFPLIFGVNIWPYDLFTPAQPDEEGVNDFGGPYSEPFESDPDARKILEEALLLVENIGGKDVKYIFSIEPETKIISQITLVDERYRSAGFRVSAITGWTKDNIMDSDTASMRWESYPEAFFVKQQYVPAMDRLARKLYQFRDEIPRHIDYDPPSDYKGPLIRFQGNKYAAIWSNLYSHNLQDMCNNKVDADGRMHTSSKGSPNFGAYVGFGTYKSGVGAYYKHVFGRDIGRLLIELIEHGEEDKIIKSAERVLDYLYDKGLRYKQPNWKRVINADEIGDPVLSEYVSGKENDGHGMMMLFIYRLVQHLCVNTDWLRENWQDILASVQWIEWQMEHPEESNFRKVLYSESEASTQEYGGYDFYSNVMIYYGLKAFSKLAVKVDEKMYAQRWNQMAEDLWKGMMEAFSAIHPRYGFIWADTLYDVWTWEYKRLAPLLLAPDLTGYDLLRHYPELYRISLSTYKAQKEDCFNPASGRQMGYGQGYLTQAAILLDQYEDMTNCLEEAGAFCYHHTDYNYIVPEGVIVHPSGRFWFRNCDLGNAVQQAEIIKCARLLIGLDDLRPETGLAVVPRLPNGWNAIEIGKYPIVAETKNGVVRCTVTHYTYSRVGNGFELNLKFDLPIKLEYVRIGPFPSQVKQVLVDGWNGSNHLLKSEGIQHVYLEGVDLLQSQILVKVQIAG